MFSKNTKFTKIEASALLCVALMIACFFLGNAMRNLILQYIGFILAFIFAVLGLMLFVWGAVRRVG